MRALLPLLLVILLLADPVWADTFPRPSARPIREASYPAQVAGFTRGEFIEYDASAHNVSVGYVMQRPNLLVSATVYLYENVGTLDDQVAGASYAITEKYPGAEVLERSAMSLSRKGRTFDGRRITYSFISHFNGAPQQLYSALLVFEVDGRFVKVRLTTPYHDAEAADQHLQELLKRIDWQSWPSDTATAPEPDPDAQTARR